MKAWQLAWRAAASTSASVASIPYAIFERIEPDSSGGSCGTTATRRNPPQGGAVWER